MSATRGQPTSLAPRVAALLERLPDELAAEEARTRLLGVARRLPDSLSAGPMGLELRLAGPKAVDLFAAATPGSPRYEALIGALRTPGWADDRRALALAQALASWRSGVGSLPAVARYLWVEADSGADLDAPVAVPSIFVAPRRPRDSTREGMLRNAFRTRPETTTRAAAELGGLWPDPVVAQELVHVSDVLPDEADIFMVGVMISRGSAASVRLVVRYVTPEQIHELLRAIGRPVQAEVIADYCAHTCAQRQAVAFEIGPGAEPRVGLELSPPSDWEQASDVGWPELLAETVHNGLAERDRAAVALGLIEPAGDPLWGLAHVKVAANETGIVPGSKLYVGLLYRSASQEAP